MKQLELYRDGVEAFKELKSSVKFFSQVMSLVSDFFLLESQKPVTD